MSSGVKTPDGASGTHIADARVTDARRQAEELCHYLLNVVGLNEVITRKYLAELDGTLPSTEYLNFEVTLKLRVQYTPGQKLCRRCHSYVGNPGGCTCK
jgi:hypothetical protein